MRHVLSANSSGGVHKEEREQGNLEEGGDADDDGSIRGDLGLLWGWIWLRLCYSRRFAFQIAEEGLDPPSSHD